VGPPDALSAFGIRVVAPLEGVGKNLQDHPVIGIAVECTKPISLRKAEAPMAYLEYAARRTGPLCSNIAEAGAFVRSYSSAEAPDIQFHFAPAYYVEHGFVRPPGHGFSIGPTLIAPASRGRLTLRSAQPLAPPLICGNHLSEASDMKALVAGLKLAREIAAAPAFVSYRGAEYMPGAATKTDQDLENHTRSMVELLYHPCGTCKMGKDDQSVVDPELRVRGVSGLRVADASVMPTIPRGNINAPTIMIAERLSAWLRDERGTSTAPSHKTAGGPKAAPSNKSVRAAS
jgi:choline dehydrogenase